MQPVPSTPPMDTPRMQLETVLETLMREGFPLRGSVLAVGYAFGIWSPDRAIYEQAS